MPKRKNPTQSPPATAEVRFRTLTAGVKFVAIVVGAVVASATTICAWLKPPVVPEPVPMTDDRPLALPFVVKNTQPFPITIARYSCDIVDLETVSFKAKNVTVLPEPINRNLPTADQMTAKCEFDQIVQPQPPIKVAVLRLSLEYKWFHVLPRTAQYYFSGVFTDGKLIKWLPM